MVFCQMHLLLPIGLANSIRLSDARFRKYVDEEIQLHQHDAVQRVSVI